MLAETARLLCLGLSSTFHFLLHVHFKSVGFFLINARSLRDRPAFYYVTFGDLKRKG